MIGKAFLKPNYQINKLTTRDVSGKPMKVILVVRIE